MIDFLLTCTCFEQSIMLFYHKTTFLHVQTNKPRVRKLKLRHVVTDADVKRHMSTPMIDDALEMGFDGEQIGKVVKRRLGELGKYSASVS